MSNTKDFIIENGVLKENVSAKGDVVIPEGVHTIGYGAFTEARYYGADDAPAVTSVTIPEGVRVIGPNAFSYCQELKKVVLPKSLEKIGSYAFDECVELEDLVIPEGVTEVADRAFAGCKKLNIAVPANIKSIEEAAFRGCALTSIVIPEGINKVGKDAFKNCNKIKTAGPVGGGYDYEFPWTEEIPDNAFSGLKKLKKAVLPATIKKVGGNAFKDCKALTDLTMPKAAKVHKTAFKGCDKLVDIKEPAADTAAASPKEGKQAPDFLITNGRLVKYRGKALEVVIPEGVTVIGKKAFWALKITSVTVPASVTAIEEEAFGNCSNLETVNIAGTVEKVGAMAFGWIRNADIERQIHAAIALRAFSKSDVGVHMKYFGSNISQFDLTAPVCRDNLQFLGSHLRKSSKIGGEALCLQLADNDALRHALLEANAVSVKEVGWAVTVLQEHPDAVAELLDYKQRLLADPKTQKALEKSEERELEKSLSPQMSVADWRKIFKFTYEDGEAVITEVRSSDPVITVPAKIGTKNVRGIAGRAFFFGSGKASPKTVTVSGGVREIRKAAFYVIKDCEIFLPESITSLPEGCFVAVHNLTLHLTAAITDIHKDVVWDSPDPAIKAICAPAGSYAETYAKEQSIPFVAE